MLAVNSPSLLGYTQQKNKAYKEIVMPIKITEPMTDEAQQIITPQALELLEQLESRFGAERKALIAERQTRQQALDQGGSLDFLAETKEIRESVWQGASIPADIQDRRVEITGPVDRKMMINALNSGAKVFMADLEDAHSPTWQATVDGQINLRDAINDSLTYQSPEGKKYQVNPQHAVLMVRVRGLHMEEKHALLNEQRVSGSFFDLAVFLTNNYQQALQRNKGLYFYIPKTEHYLEARLWAKVFNYAEQFLGIEQGTLRCTLLIETIPAAFQMEEILYELKDYIVGLNAGRWDYIFNFIKRFRNHPDKVLPERAQVTMTTHFLRSYSKLLIEVCHKRGVHAMGGMAAQIPIKNDPDANAQAEEKVRNDKLREVQDGHDGTWVAHPALVAIAKQVFDEYMPEPNQITKQQAPLNITAKDLLTIPEGTITDAGISINVSAAMRYIKAWLQGSGAVPIFNLMEDAATAEISRAQLWQWIRVKDLTSTDGQAITLARIEKLIANEVAYLKENTATDEHQSIEQAATIIQQLVANDNFEEFLTTPAYELI